MKTINTITTIILIYLLSSCSVSTDEEKPDDFLNDFIESEIDFLENNNATISKFALVNGGEEQKEYVPNWADELSFLNEYINDFRKDGKLPKPNSEIAGDTLIKVFKKSENKELKVFYVNENLIKFTINENRNSLFSSRAFQLNYNNKTGFSLMDYSKSLWVMESNAEIQASFSIP